MQSLRQQATSLPPACVDSGRQIADMPGGRASAGERDGRDSRRCTRRRSCRPCHRPDRGPLSVRRQRAPTCRSPTSAALFGYGGVFDKFFADQSGEAGRHVAARRGRGVRARSSASRPIAASSSRRRSAIRDMFFRPGAKTPAVQLLRDASASSMRRATRFVLEIDGQTVDDTAPRSTAGRMAGAGPGKRDRAHVRGAACGDPPQQRFDGPWAWFRLIDADADERSADAQQRIRDDDSRTSYHRACRSPSRRRAQPATRSRTAAWQQFSCGVVIEPIPMQVGLLRQAAEPRRLPAPARLRRVRRRLGRLAAGVPGGQPAALGERWLDVYLTSPAWRFVCAAGRLRPGAGHRPDGAQRRPRRPLLPVDPRRRAARRRQPRRRAATLDARSSTAPSGWSSRRWRPSRSTSSASTSGVVELGEELGRSTPRRRRVARPGGRRDARPTAAARWQLPIGSRRRAGAGVRAAAVAAPVGASTTRWCCGGPKGRRSSSRAA